MCASCEVFYINGVKCHELGCPDSWRDDNRSCEWCDGDFVPKFKEQNCCSADCASDYYGIDVEYPEV